MVAGKGEAPAVGFCPFSFPLFIMPLSTTLISNLTKSGLKAHASHLYDRNYVICQARDLVISEGGEWPGREE